MSRVPVRQRTVVDCHRYIAMLTRDDDWKPEFRRMLWGGSALTNVIFPSGERSVVAPPSRSQSGKFEALIRGVVEVFPTRRAAGYALRDAALREWRELLESLEA